MKKHIAIIATVALLGAGLFAYPIVSNHLFAANASQGIQQYNDTVDGKDDEILAEILRKATVYNENLAGDPEQDPFLAGSGMIVGQNYMRFLNIDNTGIMGYIQIPKIGVKLSVFHSTQENVLQRGAGHLEGSSLPIGGAGAHAVITGHSGLAHARMFTGLPKLEKGDVFYIHVLDQTLAYQIDQIKTVLPEETEDLKKIKNEDYCTLVTCTPYGVNTHRLLVRGRRIEYIPGAEWELIENSPSYVMWLNEWNILVGIVAGLVILAAAFVLIITGHIRKNKICAERELVPWETEGTTRKTVGGRRRRRPKSEKTYWWEGDGGL